MSHPRFDSLSPDAGWTAARSGSPLLGRPLPEGAAHALGTETPRAAVNAAASWRTALSPREPKASELAPALAR